MATVLADRKEADDHKQIAVGEEEKSKASVAEASELQAACEAELARAGERHAQRTPPRRARSCS